MAQIHKLRSISSVETPIPKNKIQKSKESSDSEKKGNYSESRTRS